GDDQMIDTCHPFKHSFNTLAVADISDRCAGRADRLDGGLELGGWPAYGGDRRSLCLRCYPRRQSGTRASAKHKDVSAAKSWCGGHVAFRAEMQGTNTRSFHGKREWRKIPYGSCHGRMTWIHCSPCDFSRASLN